MNDRTGKAKNAIKKFLCNHGEDILALCAGGLVVATGITAYSVGKDCADPEMAISTKVRKSILPVSLGTGAILCIAQSRAISRRRQADLIAAGALLSSSFANFKEAVNATVSDDERAEIERRYVESNGQSNNGCYGIEETGFGEDVFVEAFTGRKWKSSLDKVMEAIDMIDDDFCMLSVASLNSFYGYNGISSTPLGNNAYWCLEDMLDWYFDDMDEIDFKKFPETLGICIQHFEGVGYVIFYEHLPVIHGEQLSKQ